VRAKLARARAGLFKATVIGLLFNVVSMFDPNIGFARPAQVLAFGDSLTSGLGLPTSQAFPARLEAWLRQQGLDVFIINAGVAGDTTTDGLARIDWSLATKPDFVILALGANDAMRGISPMIVRDNLEKMIDKVQASGAKLLLLGMVAPANWGADYQHAFDAIYPDLAKAHGLPLYPFFLEGVAMNPYLNQPDGLHPNEHGVALMVDHIAPLVAKMMSATTLGEKS